MSVSDGLTAFEAHTGTLNNQNVYFDVIDGIYPGNTIQVGSLQTIMETGMNGGIIDLMLQNKEMPIVGLGIEREGFRSQNLAITISMPTAREGWGGDYLATLQVIS